jgi:outer membrane protein TolC
LNRKALIVFIALASIGLGAVAETTITIDHAVKLALANNLGLAETKITIDAAKRSSAKAWSSILPSVSALAGASRINASGATSAWLGASLSMSVSGSFAADMKKAVLDYQSDLISYETAQRTLELNVRKAFYQLLVYGETVKLKERSIKTSQDEYSQTLVRQRAGLVSELDMLSAQVSLENLTPELQAAKKAYGDLLDSFKQFLGIGHAEAVSLSGSLEDIADIGTLREPAADTPSLSVQGLRKNLESARAQREAVALGAYLPSVSLGWTYRPTYSAGAWADSGSLSASLTWSIDGFLPFTASNERILAADDAVKTYELRLKAQQASDEVDVAALRAAIAQAQSSMQALRLTQQKAQRTYDLTNEAYKNGTKSLLELSNAADSLQAAQVNVLSESYTLAANILQLEYDLNVPFGSIGSSRSLGSNGTLGGKTNDSEK